MDSTARGLVLACALVLAACGGQASGVSARSSSSRANANSEIGDWTQFDYDAVRSGVGPTDTGITAQNLSRLSRRTIHLDGTVDSAPIELQHVPVRGRIRDVIVITTSYGRTIAIDAHTGGKLWEYVPPHVAALEGSAQVTTATPIADPDRRYVYAASSDGRIRKLALSTGHEVRSAHWPVAITTDPTKEKIASALNLSGNSVIAVTGGYIGDAPPYDGHVVMIDRSSGRITNVWNTLCADRHRLIAASSCPTANPRGDSAIWARAGAVIEPGSGRILVATGNGGFDGRTNWGDSVLELTADATRLLHNWTPTNQAQLNANDLDVGSTAPALLPVTGGRHLAVQGGKDGSIYLLDLDRLDGTRGGAGPKLGGELQRIASPGGDVVLTAPAVWTGGGRTYVFVADDSSTTAYVLRPGRRPSLGIAWTHGTPGTSPVVAGGLLYVYDELSGKLVVRQPRSGGAIASLAAPTGHWNSPIVIGGRIVLPVGAYGDHLTTGELEIYHLPGR